jgi:hypothetical protein
MMLAAWFRAGVNKGVVALPQQRRNRCSCLLTRRLVLRRVKLATIVYSPQLGKA